MNSSLALMCARAETGRKQSQQKQTNNSNQNGNNNNSGGETSGQSGGSDKQTLSALLGQMRKSAASLEENEDSGEVAQSMGLFRRVMELTEKSLKD